jgi:CRP-like cAMP-binding protein
MVVQLRNDVKAKIQLLKGLSESELSRIFALCEERTFEVGELCQKEGESTGRVYFILEGRVGTITRIPNINYLNSEIFLDIHTVGDSFGWLALFKSTPIASLKALDTTKVLSIDAEKLLELCETDNHIGYVFMRNLASMISSRLRRNRLSTLNALVAIKGDW